MAETPTEQTGGFELVGDSEEKAAAEKKAQRSSKTFSRRNFITGIVGGAVGGVVLGGGVAFGATNAVQNDASEGGAAYDRIDLNKTVAFYDREHPAGITEAQRYLAFGMFNMKQGVSRDKLQLLLARWTAAIAMMQEGKPLGDIRPDYSGSSIPKDMGEAFEIAPSSLTVTIGFGASLFDERFGLESFKPVKLEEYERITGEKLVAAPGGDLAVQVCADDRQVTFHALRSLTRLARGTATLDFVQQGFLPVRQSDDQPTPRDLFGFRDGSTNPTQDKELDDFVWVSGGDQPWMEGGSYMCYGRTITDIETWENDRISDQELLIGRRKDTGAPLSKPDGNEFDIPDLEAKDEFGNYLIDPNSHVAVTSDQRLGFKVLRHGFNYWEGLNDHGDQLAGFANITYVNDPRNYWKLRDDMGKYDRLNEYYYDDRRGIYAVAKAPASGSYIGQDFFE